MTSPQPQTLPPEKRRTRAEQVKQQLADAIVKRVLAPGTVLDEAELAARFAVSRTPVREAIRDLAAMGLIEVRPHRGAIVTHPDPRRLADMFEVMAELESLCARRSAVAMSGAERSALEVLHAQLGERVRANDIDGYRDANDRFHSAIYQGSKNSYLVEMTTATRRRLSPFRMAQFLSMGRLSHSYAEHAVIVDAILQGDAETAARAMRDHILVVEETFEQMEF